MNRTPIAAPLPCFSLEYETGDPKCRQCRFAADCRKYMGKRASVRLCELSFKLMPERLDENDRLKQVDACLDPEFLTPASLQQLYEECHFTIFEEPANDRLDLKPDAVSKLAEACAQAGCTARMFTLACMYGFKISSPGRKFYASMLLGPHAIKRASLYRKACAAEFGTFDLRAMDDLTGSENRQIQERMLNSEIIAGQWITGYKLKFVGPYGLKFYGAKELAMDPYWLAIEPSYINLVLLPNLGKTSGIPQLDRHRFNVSKLHHELKLDAKRKGNMARAVFRLREQNAPKAVAAVLDFYRLNSEQFGTSETVVTDMFTFWGNLALGLKNYFVERLLDGDTSALTYLRQS